MGKLGLSALCQREVVRLSFFIFSLRLKSCYFKVYDSMVFGMCTFTNIYLQNISLPQRNFVPVIGQSPSHLPAMPRPAPSTVCLQMAHSGQFVRVWSGCVLCVWFSFTCRVFKVHPCCNTYRMGGCLLI